MASVSVELLNQAEQLQSTIAFFKIEGAAAAGVDTAKDRSPVKSERRIRTVRSMPGGSRRREAAGPPFAAAMPPAVHEGHAGASKGFALELAQNLKGDAADEDFERY